MAYLIKRERGELTKFGLERVAHIPFLMTRGMEYAEEPSRYLRERALGLWHPRKRERSAYGFTRLLSERTIASYGDDLKIFLSFLERRRLDWKTITHLDVMHVYDTGMTSGKIKTRSGAKLEVSTINRRVGIALEFLLWASDRSYRPLFEISTTLAYKGVGQNGRRSGVSKPSVIGVRVGIHRVHPKRLRLPTSEEIQRFEKAVKHQQGFTKHLAVRWIFQTGCRLEETALVREAQLPDPSLIDLDRPVRMTICYGTKGERIAGDQSKRGKPRDLRFNRSFLVEVDVYRRLRRPKALERFRKLNPGKPDPLELFLNEATGQPFSRQAIYRAWHNTEFTPFKQFSPHHGRHAFACYTLLHLLDEEATRAKQTIAAMPRATVLTHADALIKLYLSPVLGHVNEATTTLYLEWITDHILVAEHRKRWANYLDEDQE